LKDARIFLPGRAAFAPAHALSRTRLHPEIVAEVVLAGDRVVDEFVGGAFEDDTAGDGEATYLV
jgi:hypothetical protein